MVDSTTEKDIDQIADAVKLRLNQPLEKIATSCDLGLLATKEDVGRLTDALSGLRSFIEEKLPQSPGFHG